MLKGIRVYLGFVSGEKPSSTTHTQKKNSDHHYMVVRTVAKCSDCHYILPQFSLLYIMHVVTVTILFLNCRRWMQEGDMPGLHKIYYNFQI